MPDLYNAQFTRFEHSNFPQRDEWRDTAKLVPTHYIREWQFPKNGAGEAVFKTVRISEHKWPMRNAYNCHNEPVSRQEDETWVHGGWPHDLNPIPALDRDALIVRDRLRPWHWFPAVSDMEPCLSMDDVAWNVHARDSETGRGGLPDDYLEFWLETDDIEAKGE
jgi:hypothetical protein